MTKLLHFGAAAAVCLVLAASGGCTAFLEPREPYPITPPEASPFSAVPRELDMVSLPPYVIEPPDILMINAVKIVPKPPHHLEPFDGILVRVVDASGLQIIGDAYVIDPEGMIDLGPEYGRVNVVGMTVVEAHDAIRRHLAATLEDPEVSVSLAFSAGAQQIVGEHLVGPDGRVNLGTYGSVYVAGMTIDEVARDDRTSTVELPVRSASGGRHLCLQQQEILRGDARRRPGRQCGRVAHHRQRNGA